MLAVSANSSSSILCVGSNKRLHDLSNMTRYENSDTAVPIVDLSVFGPSGDFEARRLAARELAKKCRPFGAVGITGHGVSSDLLQEAFDTAKRLFNLPYEEKMKAPHPNGPTPHRGYSGTGRERVAAKTQTETKDETQKGVYSKITDFKVQIRY